MINFWLILLIALAAQDIFLIAVFMIRPPKNKNATKILIGLLGIIFCIVVSNILTASGAFRFVTRFAGFARGMVLLLGPFLFFYTRSLLRPGFRFGRKELLHLFPYSLALVIIRFQEGLTSREEMTRNINHLIEGKAEMDFLSTLWFVSYFIHLSIYLWLSIREMKYAVKDKQDNYLIPVEERISWLKKIGTTFLFVAIIFAGIVIYTVITGVYGITGNFIYTLTLAAMVYLIAFQAVTGNKILFPDFAVKYKSGKIGIELKKIILNKLRDLFEKEKVFTDPDLSLNLVAKKVNAHPNIISQIINESFQKTFNELVNYYRVEEFKERARNPKYSNYSIIGIANDVGYNSKSSFIAAFKKQNGITPSEYLRKVLKHSYKTV
jgi:AraC-like DNA-binding protein